MSPSLLRSGSPASLVLLLLAAGASDVRADAFTFTPEPLPVGRSCEVTEIVDGTVSGVPDGSPDRLTARWTALATDGRNVTWWWRQQGEDNLVLMGAGETWRERNEWGQPLRKPAPRTRSSIALGPDVALLLRPVEGIAIEPGHGFELPQRVIGRWFPQLPDASGARLVLTFAGLQRDADGRERVALDLVAWDAVVRLRGHDVSLDGRGRALLDPSTGVPERIELAGPARHGKGEVRLVVAVRCTEAPIEFPDPPRRAVERWLEAARRRDVARVVSVFPAPQLARLAALVRGHALAWRERNQLSTYLDLFGLHTMDELMALPNADVAERWLAWVAATSPVNYSALFEHSIESDAPGVTNAAGDTSSEVVVRRQRLRAEPHGDLRTVITVTRYPDRVTLEPGPAFERGWRHLVSLGGGALAHVAGRAETDAERPAEAAPLEYGEQPVAEKRDPMLVAAGVTPPVLVRKVEPVYPAAARSAAQKGKVIVQCVIEEDGTVSRVKILKSEAPSLDKSVVDAVRQWRYKPATLQGKPVPVFFTVVVTFKLP